MKKHIRLILPMLLVAFFASGCSPVYKLVDRYEPPAHTRGLSCIQSCGQAEVQCTNQCTDKRENCEYYAVEEARVEYNQALSNYTLETERYAIDLREYYADLRDYEHKVHRLEQELADMRDSCAAGDKYGCKHAQRVERELSHNAQPAQPDEPVRPTLDVYRRNAIASCDLSCGCKEAFNTCYVTCGGRVTQDRICVDNCE